jgi:hypothetical protein
MSAMAKKLLSLVVLLCAATPAFANSDPYRDFALRAQQSLLKPFALDLGGIIGGASFHDGRSLGFPGFKIYGVGVVQSHPDKNNLILRNAGVKTFGLPMIEAVVGLPYKFDLVAHGLEVNGTRILGGGIRYCVYRSGLVDKFLPNVGVAGYGDGVKHNSFSATHWGANVSASWTLPIVEPFLGAGFDVTKIKVDGAATVGVVGQTATASGSRFIAGANLKAIPFTRIHAAYMLLHGIGAAQFGLGVQF